jgi:hypothetical protein
MRRRFRPPRRFQAGEHPQTDDDSGTGQVLTDAGTRGLRGDRSDDQRGEALEYLHLQRALDGRRERGFDRRERDDTDADRENARRLFDGRPVHLGEDDRDRRTSAEDEQADLDDADRRTQCAGENHRREDTVHEGKPHDGRQQLCRAAYLSL